MERWRSKAPALAVVLTLVMTVFSISTYEAPSYAAPEGGQAQAKTEKKAAAAATPKLAQAAATPARSASGQSSPSGSKTVSKVSDENKEYKDGTYYGSAAGYRGKTKVKVVVKDGKIASISVVSTGDDASYFDRAKSLLDKIVSTQSTNVDTVSGCTYSSAGLINAVRNALSKAAVSDKAKKSNKKTTTKSTKKTKKSKSSKNKKKKNYSSTTKVSKDKQGAFPYPDGTYYGTAEGFVGDIIVAVTIKNKTITKIAVVSQEDDEEYFDEAVAVVDRMIKAQSTKVDTVSGATYSSKGLINAVINALKEAKAAADKQKQTATQTKPGTPAQPADPTKATDPTKSTDPSDVTKPSGTEDPEKPGDDSSDDPTDPT